VSSCFVEATMNKVNRVLDVATWQQHRQRLKELGGPPYLN
jgi:hypothetical protein